MRIKLAVKYKALRLPGYCLFWQTRHDRQLCYLKMHMISIDVDFVFVYDVTHESLITMLIYSINKKWCLLTVSLEFTFL